jgi:hypothetical protein
LQVGAGRGQVRVPQLALDQRQRNPLTQQLDSMSMAELSASASLIRSPARQSTTINPLRRLPYRARAAWRMTAMISSTVGGSAA